MERWELVCMCLLLPSRWGDVTAYLRANCKENGTQTPEGKPNAQRAVLRGGVCGGAGCGRPEGGKGWGRLPWGQEEGDFLFQVFMSSQ